MRGRPTRGSDTPVSQETTPLSLNDALTSRPDTVGAQHEAT
jgi:hypothetical protein